MSRLNTFSAIDFVYWVQKRIENTTATFDADLVAPEVAFDAAELANWAAQQVGLFFPVGADDQIEYCAYKGTEIAVADALNVRGAILWAEHAGGGHVGITIGRQRVVQDNGRGVAEIVNGAQSYTRSGKIPGMIY